MTRSAQETIAAFTAGLPFTLDAFQREAIEHLLAGRDVLVAAPTGARKTVGGEFACAHALDGDGTTFYTTPIKALSNQKYRDLCARHGEDRVGLLTGDRSVNGRAPIVVMTTEILRNMIYEDDAVLERLRYVVLDEVHAMAGSKRGAHLALSLERLDALVQDAGGQPTQRVGLSATVRPVQTVAEASAAPVVDAAAAEPVAVPARRRVRPAYVDPTGYRV
jgi:Lhr-like helicase